LLSLWAQQQDPTLTKLVQLSSRDFQKNMT
jgi:hypothetical protein